MAALVDRPGLLLVVSFAGLLLAAMLGVVAQKVWNPVKATDQSELAIVQSAALTLLGLIVGFSFAMAISRYDQRKTLEEAEANAIGTSYVRADLMPEGPAAAMRSTLKGYLDQRIQFYETSDQGVLERIGAETEDSELISGPRRGLSPPLNPPRCRRSWPLASTTFSIPPIRRLPPGWIGFRLRPGGS
jgi:hypothetical protein